MSVGWLKKRRSGGTPVEPGDLVARRVQALGDGAAGHAQVVGQLGAEERGGLVEVGLVGARLGDGAAEVLLHRQQQAVDVLELRPPLLALGERDRADHRVVQVAAAALKDLVLVDVQQRGDDVLGDRRRLVGQRPVAAEPQRAHPERRMPEIQEPDALATVGRREPQAQPAELALGVDDDDRRVARPEGR